MLRQIAPRGVRRVWHPLARDNYGEAKSGFDFVQELLVEPIGHGLVFRRVFVAVEDCEHRCAACAQTTIEAWKHEEVPPVENDRRVVI